MHEWGHLAHAAKFLRVPDENKLAYKEARAELGDCFLKAIAAIPEITRSMDAETAGLSLCSNHLPPILARKTLARVGDYLSNLMCSKMLPGEEMQIYVRTNVRHHFDEKLGLVSELARYAYEVHYLAWPTCPGRTSSTHRASSTTLSIAESSPKTIRTPCSTLSDECLPAMKLTRQSSRFLPSVTRCDYCSNL